MLILSAAQGRPNGKALEDGLRGREILCDFGVHNARHCLGVLDNLNFFSIEAFVNDCEAQRQYQKNRVEQPGVKPLQTLWHLRSFSGWRATIIMWIITPLPTYRIRQAWVRSNSFRVTKRWIKRAATLV